MVDSQKFFDKRPRESGRLVARVHTSIFKTKRGVASARQLSIMRRQSTGYDYFSHDVEIMSAHEVVKRVLNFDEVPDGLYLVTIVNIKRDWETDTVSDYQYRLIPYTPCPHNSSTQLVMPI